MLLERADCLHQGSLKVIADAHNLSGRLHLSRQRSLRADKLIERKARDLHHAVVQHRLKARVRLACDRVRNLVKRIAKGNLGGNLRDRVSGRLGSER